MEAFGFPLEAIFIVIVVLSVSVWLDLAQHRDGKEITFKDAAMWSMFWVALSLCFYAYLYFRFDPEYASLFLAGYALEKSLSADNMIVIMGIMSSFGILSGHLQHRILYYGIIGALLFRAVFVGAGSWLFSLGPVIQLLFGAIVIWTAWMMIKSGGGDDDEEEVDYTKHWSVRYIKKHFPIAQGMVEDKFFVTEHEAAFSGVRTEVHGNWISRVLFAGRYATVAFLCLMCVEISDIVFSFDSVPAIIAITKEPFLVYTSIIFAVLGLRSLYFLLKVAIKYLVHLDKAVALILVYVGVKLMLPALHAYFPVIPDIHIHHFTSLYVVLSLLVLGVLASFMFPNKPLQT